LSAVDHRRRRRATWGARSGEESWLNGTFLAFLSIACLLAVVGVITDSPVTLASHDRRVDHRDAGRPLSSG
jgi:hypothetical protein